MIRCIPFRLSGILRPIALTLMIALPASGQETGGNGSAGSAVSSIAPEGKHVSEPVTLVVAADGSGKFRSVGEAVRAASSNDNRSVSRCIIRVKPGIYREKLVIPKHDVPITIVGDNSVDTVLTFTDCAETLKADGTKVGTFDSASTTVLSDDFVAENITFQNAHGAGSQALAIHVAGDRAIFRQCRFLGWQDTILLRQGRQYFEGCFIEGHVDFIFGGATAFFERCELHCLGNGYITAASTPQEQRHGFVFSNCRITAVEKVSVYLGRPWRPSANVVFVKTLLPDAVRPEGWNNWGDPSRESTVRFAECQSRGPGANSEKRVPWARTLMPEEAEALSPQQVLGTADNWNPLAVPSARHPGSETSSRLTPERIAFLPPEEQQRWTVYMERSAKRLETDKAMLQAELQANGMVEALRPPTGKDFKLPSHNAAWFASEEAVRFADVALSFQTPSGGWSKAVSYDKGARLPGMQWSSQASPAVWHYVGTFDNRATIEQMRLLAGVYQATGRQEFRDGFMKGLEYIFDAQFPNGGWPQVYPLEGGYHDAITFNDDTMIHVLELLQDIALGAKPEFGFVETRERAAAALSAGINCLLKTQFVQNGRRTVWGAQHDPVTLAPVSARLKEPAALSGAESDAIVEFLMRVPEQSPEIVRAIQDALVWFDQSKLTGLRSTERDGRSFWEDDPSAAHPVWARFCDLVTNQPIFGGSQDGIVYDSFEAMWRNNRFGYDFYTDTPRRLLSKSQEIWREALKRSGAELRQEQTRE